MHRGARTGAAVFCCHANFGTTHGFLKVGLGIIKKAESVEELARLLRV